MVKTWPRVSLFSFLSLFMSCGYKHFVSLVVHLMLLSSYSGNWRRQRQGGGGPFFPGHNRLSNFLYYMRGHVHAHTHSQIFFHPAAVACVCLECCCGSQHRIHRGVTVTTHAPYTIFTTSTTRGCKCCCRSGLLLSSLLLCFCCGVIQHFANTFSLSFSLSSPLSLSRRERLSRKN